MTTAIILKSYIAISRVIAITSTFVTGLRGEATKIKKAYEAPAKGMPAHA